MTRSLDEWLAYQDRVNVRSIELGLDRVSAVWQRMGAPAPARRVITVGGTNGKGSTVAMLAAAGRRVGSYTLAAVEKAGIAREGRPVIVGELDPPAGLLEALQRIGAKVQRAGVDFTVERLTEGGWRWRHRDGTTLTLPDPTRRWPRRCNTPMPPRPSRPCMRWSPAGISMPRPRPACAARVSGEQLLSYATDKAEMASAHEILSRMVTEIRQEDARSQPGARRLADS